MWFRLHSIGRHAGPSSRQPECVPDGGFELTDLAIGELDELLGDDKVTR